MFQSEIGTFLQNHIELTLNSLKPVQLLMLFAQICIQFAFTVNINQHTYNNQHTYILRQLLTKMKRQKKATNLLLMSTTIIFLYLIHKQILSTSHSFKALDILQRIFHNQHFSYSQLEEISALVYANNKKIRDLQGIQCLLRIYYQFMLETTKNQILIDFGFLHDTHYQYNKISKCSDFLLIMIDHYENNLKTVKESELKVRNSLQILQKMQRQYYTTVYQHPTTQKINFCIILRTYNNEKNVKQQLKSILQQEYAQNYKLYLVDDASDDNTYIHSKYFLDQYAAFQSDKEKNIAKEKYWEHHGQLYVYNHYMMKHCQNNDIVLIIKNEHKFIGKNAIYFLSKVFTNEDIKIASFNFINQDMKNVIGKELIHQNANQERFIVDELQQYFHKHQQLYTANQKNNKDNTADNEDINTEEGRLSQGQNNHLQQKSSVNIVYAFRKYVYNSIDKKEFINPITKEFYKTNGQEILAYTLLNQTIHGKNNYHYKHINQIVYQQVNNQQIPTIHQKKITQNYKLVENDEKHQNSKDLPAKDATI